MAPCLDIVLLRMGSVCPAVTSVRDAGDTALHRGTIRVGGWGGVKDVQAKSHTFLGDTCYEIRANPWQIPSL